MSSSDPRPEFPTHLVAAVAVIVVAALGGYLLGGRAATPSAADLANAVPSASPTVAATTAPLSDVARDAISRTVTIESVRSTDEELGTGWLFDTKGDFVTNAHVVDGALAVRIRDRRGRTHDGLVIGSDREQDVAVIRSADGFPGTPLRISHQLPALDDQVVAVASGRATGHADVTVEQVARLHADVPVKGNPEVDPNSATTTTTYHDMVGINGAQIYPGDSGGPVLNSRGEVMGIVTLASKTGAQAFAIPIGKVNDELARIAARSGP